MMVPSLITFLLIYIVFYSATSHALPGSAPQPNVTNFVFRPSRNAIVQQHWAVGPPLPILEIGLQHILSMTGENATKAENVSITEDASRHSLTSPPLSSKFTSLRDQQTPAQCSPTQPCIDGSCCNSEGKCGFMPYNCKNTAATSCISNCNAHAMCGVDSLNSEQKCPLDLCCSYLGYCGTTDIYCTQEKPLPCQPGFGNCQVVPAPFCPHGQSTTKGRRVAYWQSHNVRDRECDRAWPSQIDTTGITHLVFAFVSIDPVSFQVLPADPADIPLFSQFTALKSTVMQTWIAVGGGGFSDPGPTQFTWSAMASYPANRAVFISSLCVFMEKYGFQGVDLDWEFPTVASRGGRPEDTANLLLLLTELRAEFGSRYGISAALPTDVTSLAGFNPGALQQYVTFFNYMAYDIHGPWEVPYLGAFARPQASITEIDKLMTPLWFDSVDPVKINLGIPYYGRGVTLTNTSCTDVGCPWTDVSRAGQCSGSPGILTLKEIEVIIKERNLVPKVIPDTFQKQITFGGDQWIAYDDKDTIKRKTQWEDDHCLGGTAVWSIDFIAGNGKPAPVVTPPSAPLAVSIDGSCGVSSTCLGSKFGDCCSKYGYCGSTSGYCSPSSGCRESFGLCGDSLVAPISPTSTIPAASTTTSSEVTSSTPITNVSIDGSCGHDTTCLGSTLGNCCSKNGYCGSTAAYCSVNEGCQSSFGRCGSGTSTMVTTTSASDGSCGNGVACSGSVFGNCCSKYGYCGSSPIYCGPDSGCQKAFGTCPIPLMVSVNGACGMTGGMNVTCQGSAYGNCCSPYGYCGSTANYCGSGCQATFGTCQ